MNFPWSLRNRHDYFWASSSPSTYIEYVFITNNSNIHKNIRCKVSLILHYRYSHFYRNICDKTYIIILILEARNIYLVKKIPFTLGILKSIFFILVLFIKSLYFVKSGQVMHNVNKN